MTKIGIEFSVRKMKSHLMKLREKIELRMQILEHMMKKNMHIHDPTTVEQYLDRLTYCWGIMSEEDRDYIQGCQFALEEQQVWNKEVTTYPDGGDID